MNGYLILMLWLSHGLVGHMRMQVLSPICVGLVDRMINLLLDIFFNLFLPLLGQLLLLEFDLSVLLFLLLLLTYALVGE